MSAPYKNNQPEHATIIGAGLSGLLLANHLATSRAARITLYDDAAVRTDHIWGYWDNGEAFLDTPRVLARAQWQYWRIVTPRGEAVLRGETSRYQAVSSAAYEARLADKLPSNLLHINRTYDPASCPETLGALYDTAHYEAPQDCLLQHFGGVEVTADRPCFDPNIATLMDFRVTQAHGIHFIYLLPFSETQALVESTLFSPTPMTTDFYRAQIDDYLAAQFSRVRFTSGKTENGVIPMSRLRHFGHGTPIGLAGGALRASSGYAFYQIHRQIAALGLASPATPRRGASRIERWMDDIFLRVMKHNPELAPDIFLSMARHMSGDDFARFMNGHAPLSILLRVIMAVPKWPFLRRLL